MYVSKISQHNMYVCWSAWCVLGYAMQRMEGGRVVYVWVRVPYPVSGGDIYSSIQEDSDGAGMAPVGSAV